MVLNVFCLLLWLSKAGGFSNAPVKRVLVRGNGSEPYSTTIVKKRLSWRAGTGRNPVGGSLSVFESHLLHQKFEVSRVKARRNATG
jgi:hypothetical protein